MFQKSVTAKKANLKQRGWIAEADLGEQWPWKRSYYSALLIPELAYIYHMGSPGSHESTCKHSATGLAERGFSEWILGLLVCYGCEWVLTKKKKKSSGLPLEVDIQTKFTDRHMFNGLFFLQSNLKDKNIKLALDVDVFSLIMDIIHFSGILSFMRVLWKEDHRILVKRP